jgi:hypothetical protein
MTGAVVAASGLPGSLFVAVADGGTIITSPSGSVWTNQTNGFAGSYINGISWSPSLGLWVAVGQSGKTFTSPDGVTWTDRTFGAATRFTCLIWVDELNLFVAGGGSGILYTSPDGITWTSRTSNMVNNEIFEICWSPSLSLLVIVGGGGKLCTSPDGVTWTSRTSGFGTTQINGVAWSPTLNLFIAVGPSGTNSTSPTGVTWTLRTAVGTAGNTMESVIWCPAPLSFFMMVGVSASTPPYVWTSTTGTSAWTQQTMAGAFHLYSVTYSAALGLLVAVGDGGNVLTSPTGVTWTPQTSGITVTINDVGVSR